MVSMSFVFFMGCMPLMCALCIGVQKFLNKVCLKELLVYVFYLGSTTDLTEKCA